MSVLSDIRQQVANGEPVNWGRARLLLDIDMALHAEEVSAESLQRETAFDDAMSEIMAESLGVTLPPSLLRHPPSAANTNGNPIQ